MSDSPPLDGRIVFWENRYWRAVRVDGGYGLTLFGHVLQTITRQQAILGRMAYFTRTETWDSPEGRAFDRYVGRTK